MIGSPQLDIIGFTDVDWAADLLIGGQQLVNVFSLVTI